MTRLLLLWLLLSVCHAVSAKPANVLLLNSYHPQYRWTDELTHGVRDALKTQLPPENLHVEFMDSRRFVDDVEYERKLVDLLKYKYRSYKPDVVITSDDHAYYFMLAQGSELFGNVPIVFCGVNVFYPQSLVGRDNITGIKEGMEIRGNLELIVQLQPQVERIVLLGDTTGLGLRMVERAKQIKQNWHNDQVELEIWDSFTLEQLYGQAERVSSNSAFLMLAIHKDANGQYFSFDNELPILSQRAKAPIYGMWGALMIGNGVVGGMMNDPYEHGFSAANMALRILQGEPVQQLPIQDKARFEPAFDYQQLKRFNIDLERLPENSLVVGQPIGLYQQNKQLINMVVAFIVFLIGVITLLLNNIRSRRQAQKQLTEFNQQLESVVHERTKDLEERNHQLEDASSQLIAMANTDILTGLGNRRAANDEIPAFIKRYNVVYQPLALAILDIDFFKKINDSFGHQTGDEILAALGLTLKTTLRPTDKIYRWGGEEFLIMLPDTQSDVAQMVCQRIRHNIAQIKSQEVDKVTVSIGLAEFYTGDDYNHLLKRADQALYIAKNRGRDQVVIATPPTQVGIDGGQAKLLS